MSATGVYTAEIIDVTDEAGRRRLADLVADPAVTVLDSLDQQREGLRSIKPVADPDLLDEPMRWIHYPWRATVVATLGPRGFRRLRLDRNRNKITAQEQDRLAELRVGIVGLSVGHAIAHAIALDGLCGELRLADFDEIELSNLNRIPATLLDLGVNKTIVAARRIAEIDPYLTVVVDQRGFTADNADQFITGLNVVIEECDSLDVKFLVREYARRHRVPVIMETSDRGLLDVERFDLEPDRPMFHGRTGSIESADLGNLSTRDKVPYVLAILGADQLSPRMAASMIEVDRSVSTWPQLGSEVGLGGASVAAAVRRLGLGRDLVSGRVRIHLDDILDDLADPGAPEPVPESTPPPPEPADPVVAAALRAPSGGNVQPWRIASDERSLRLSVDPARTSGLDVKFRGSHVALGAALFNARVAAAHTHRLGPVRIDLDESGLCSAVMEYGNGTDPRLARAYRAVLARTTNRTVGTPAPIHPADGAALATAAREEGGHVHVVTDRAAVESIAEILCETDRLRYLTAHLHAEMISELRWPGDDDPDTGIEVSTLGMDPTDVVKLDVVRRPEVMATLAQWGAGSALGEDTRDRVRASSAIAVVTVDGREPTDFVRAGAAVENVWIAAERVGLAVHPVSPTFIFAVSDDEFATLSSTFATELSALRRRFAEVVGIGAGESLGLVLRLAHAPAAEHRSRRRPPG